ncbi:hypothetical protein HPB50_022128 [Hyalomma asiaticum]|uniref:Uncharacterized protein n=1 Tax=Hyalomma asiaticum TaxID=266040 RepID=A0ACB7TLK3_HYAAI|nr:hypothetical protein HPB50_022128 [Hyalomma asiaticum]
MGRLVEVVGSSLDLSNVCGKLDKCVGLDTFSAALPERPRGMLGDEASLESSDFQLKSLYMTSLSPSNIAKAMDTCPAIPMHVSHGPRIDDDDFSAPLVIHVQLGRMHVAQLAAFCRVSGLPLPPVASNSRRTALRTTQAANGIIVLSPLCTWFSDRRTIYQAVRLFVSHRDNGDLCHVSAFGVVEGHVFV